MIRKWLARVRRRPHDPRWPCLASMVTAWAAPAATSRRIHNPGWKSVLRTHLVVLVLAGLLTVALQVFRRYLTEDSWGNFVFDVAAEFFNIVQNLSVNFTTKLWNVLRAVAVFEASLLLVALICVPFAARNESLRDTRRAAFSRVWLHSSHVLPIMVIGTCAWFLSAHAEEGWPRHVDQQFDRLYPVPKILTLRVGGNGASAVAQSYIRAERDEMREEFRAWKQEPWYFSYASPLRLYVLVTLGGWFLVALVRGLSADRPHTALPQPPRCRWCGYVLIGVAPDRNCPECARPVADSIAAAESLGTAWDASHGVRLGIAYFQTLLAFLFMPLGSARRLRLCTSPWRTAQFLGVTAVGGAVAFGLLAVRSSAISPGLGPVTFATATRTGLVAGGAIVLLACLTSQVVALELRKRESRELLCATFQTSSYCSGYALLLWVIVGLLLPYWPRVEAQLYALSSRTGWRVEYLRTLCGATLLVLVLPMVLTLVVRRATRGVRYAYR